MSVEATGSLEATGPVEATGDLHDVAEARLRGWTSVTPVGVEQSWICC